MKIVCNKLEKELRQIATELFLRFGSVGKHQIYLEPQHFCKPLLRKNSRCKKICQYYSFYSRGTVETKEFNLKDLINQFYEYMLFNFLVEITKEADKRKIKEIIEKEIMFHVLKEKSK